MFPVSVSAIREAEALAVASGRQEYTLMYTAGRRAADILIAHYGCNCRYLLFCGGGNNGGDGMVTAAELFRRGAGVEVWAAREKSSFTGCAAQAAAELPGEIPFKLLSSQNENPLAPGDIAVDALLGIGFDGGRLRREIAKAVEWINSAHVPVAALDLPSGVGGDNGRISPDGVVKAELTIAFGGVKSGLITLPGSLYRGALRMVDIGLPPMLPVGDIGVFTNLDAVKKVPRLPVDRHKNSAGAVAVWGGSEEFPGAPQLAARGALRTGAGIVRVITPQNRTALDALIPVPPACRSAALKQSRVLVCGCGWGGKVPPEYLAEALAFEGTLVLDADALNLTARQPVMWNRKCRTVITPHPGEAARLAQGFDIPAALERPELAAALAKKLQAVTVLKGFDTLVAAPEGRVTLIAAGNAKLATAGSGDTHAGIIGALCTFCSDEYEAAILGAYIHGIAGEKLTCGSCADDLSRLAGMVIDEIRRNRLF